MTVKNKDSYTHVRGESLFVDDLSEWQGTLYASVLDATHAHARIISVDDTLAVALPGVAKIISYKDIKGENQIGGIIPDEPLLAEDLVHFQGMPIALILADTQAIAHQARKLIKVQYEDLPVITTAREAFEKGQFTNGPRTFVKNDIVNGFAQSDYIFEGEVFTNGQEHLYLETQGAHALPMENEAIKVVSSTQGPTSVQKAIAKVLGVGMHQIEVEVNRLGGGFGGKEDQATAWAALAALGCQLTGKPVKLILDRQEDLRMTGKRHPYESTFKIGLSRDLKIKAFEAVYLQNAGAAADLSPAIAERTLFHATNSYYIENVKATVHSCKTNLPPNTAFRGFGGPQGMFVIEAALVKAAKELGIPVHQIQKANLLRENDEFPYGQIAQQVHISQAWDQAFEQFEFEKTLQNITDFNLTHAHLKKGVSLMPITFGISFTNTPMNHARALVHIYQDGSVGVSTGAVEMGQSVNTKMLQVAAAAFGIGLNQVKIETTNTTRVANTSPTAASATADLNGKALRIACEALIERLQNFLRKEKQLTTEDRIAFSDSKVYINEVESDWDWNTMVNKAHWKRVNLTENGHYATPLIHFDKTQEKGHPFAYHVYGTAITEVTLDCLRGTYEIDAVKIVHDFGTSMNLDLDKGQVEGALVQGIGWMTMEEISYNAQGKLLSNTLSGYKVPDVFSVPKKIEVVALETEGHELAILKSKAVGEPPLMYGIGTYFALQNAITAFNPNYKQPFHAPMTPEKVLMGLWKH